MKETKDQSKEDEDEDEERDQPWRTKRKTTNRLKSKEIGISCMLNTEIGSVLAVIRGRPDPSTQFSPEESMDSSIIQSLKSLRMMLFNPHNQWRMTDPSVYLNPFLDVVQSDDIPAPATGVALSTIIKILKLEIFDEKTPGAREAINSLVTGITSCRLERTDPTSEDAVLMRILQVLVVTMKHRASILLTDQAVCTVVNTCFQVVQQSAGKGDLLQQNGRYTMHELIQIIYARLPEIKVTDWEDSESETEDVDVENNSESGYGIQCAVDIFHFLCSLLNVVEFVETEGSMPQTSDDMQLFALVLINSAIELSGTAIAKHPKLLRMIQDDLFHHLIYYGMRSSPLVLSMICSTVLNIYHFLRRSVRLQLEAFFSYVLFRIATFGAMPQLQEVALEGIINFCRQPTFTMEMYVNYDCDPVCRNVFEEIGKLLCKNAFPAGNALNCLQIQAFEGLIVIINSIADTIEEEANSSSFGPYPVTIKEYRPFWEEKLSEDFETWVEYVRVRKMQKRKILIAANHFNRDDKKGLEYLKLSKLISNPPDPKAYAYFFRYTPGLDKAMIGDYLGDPDEFHIEVLKEFTQTFEFTGMNLDTSLRTYLETFRLPGESQKIHRIIEAFSDKFYDQQSSELFASKDAVLVLCYSLIMLNTDQHNPQVKKKMTEEEFIRNNRQINGGKDLPREYLIELFQSIASNAFSLSGQSMLVEMNPSRWIELMNRAKSVQPFITCDFECRIGRDMFASIAGPSVAALSSIFEHADDEDLLHECIEGLFSVAYITRYGLEDILDEILASLCKFTTLLNPYASAEETLYAFSNDMKPKMAVIAVFTIANKFGVSIRGGWRNIVDCLLKLKRLKLLPQSVVEPDSTNVSSDIQNNSRSDSGILFPNPDPKFSGKRHPGTVSRFSHFLALDSMEDSVALGMSEFEQNLKIIQQCQIGNIFHHTSSLPEEPLLNLGRSLIFAAAGKGQKFSTPVEEEETVGFCWDLLTTITSANIDRFHTFWPTYHDHLLGVTQLPLFSPIPFAEKALLGQLKVCEKLLATFRPEKASEEIMFKSINLMWKLDKEVLDTCCEHIMQTMSRILGEYPANLQSQFGWKSVLQLLPIASRLPETYDQGVDSLITLLSDGFHISQVNYPYCIDCAFSFVALKISTIEKNLKILDLLADSMNLLIQWYKNGMTEQWGSMSVSNVSNSSVSSMEDNVKSLSSSNFAMSMFVKLGEALRKSSLARREEMRNHAVLALKRIFIQAEELELTPTNCINSFNLVIFAMVDDLHEKMSEYSRRNNAEKEVRSMEGTLRIAMDLLTDVYLQFLKPLSESPGFRTFWLGLLRRMDTCMKADLGEYGECKLREIIPEFLRKMIKTMKEKDILVARETDDLWEITYIQIQWIAPSLKDELFPDLTF
ncbi:Mon2/Sec7/BIG1-like, HUS domain [Dillenia turbinata]|uniref:Mon2/Sec7/BIG1-like, HUS domain n=1 Tax=Dillenia turbinata TaxID=194707 RepID=A0AAN8VWI7_9MAGN